MLRRLLKTGMACALHWTGTHRVFGAWSQKGRLPIVICYHRVVEDFTASAGRYMPSMLISRRMLERHLDWLGRRFRFVSLDELGSRLESGMPFERPAVAITFDDGYADVYHHAFPLLKRKGIPFAVFVVTDLIGTSETQIYDKLYLLLARAFETWSCVPRDLAYFLCRLGVTLPNGERLRELAKDPYAAMRTLFTGLPEAAVHRVIEALESEVKLEERELKELRAVTWDMLIEMHRVGMTIGSHSKTHVLLPNESRQRMLMETVGSRSALENRLGIPVRHFAYPNGSFNIEAVRSVADSGYRFAYTTCVHRDAHYPLLTIPRIVLWENCGADAFWRFSSSMMSCQLNGVFGFTRRCKQDHGSSAPTPSIPQVA